MRSTNCLNGKSTCWSKGDRSGNPTTVDGDLKPLVADLVVRLIRTDALIREVECARNPLSLFLSHTSINKFVAGLVARLTRTGAFDTGMLGALRIR